MEDREKPHEVLLEGPRPDAPRVLEEILTWRWSGEAPSTAREYYAKWERLSHLECEWLPEERVRQLSEAKLRNFLRKREISAPGAVSAAERAEVAGGEAVDGGGRLGVQLLQQRARAVATRRQHALAQRGDHGEEQHDRRALGKGDRWGDERAHARADPRQVQRRVEPRAP